MSLGGFGAGFAQTFDGAKFGRSINEGIADYKEEKAKKAAEDKKKQAIATLDKERFQSGATTQPIIDNLDLKNAPHVELSAVPNPSAEPSGSTAQGQALDPNQVVSVKNVAPGNPMADTTYDKRLQEINDTYDNDLAQARADYYRFRGMNKEQEEAEKKLKDMKFAQQFGMLHKNAVDGDPQAMGQLVGYMNASMGNGMEIRMGEGGKMSLFQNGQVLQKDFVPTRAQIDQAAMGMYNTAKFLRGGGDFDKYLQNMTAIKGLDMTDKKYALETAKFDEQKRATGVAEKQGQQKIDNDMYNAAEGRKVQMHGINTTASTADKDRMSRETVAHAQIQSNENINAANNNTKVLTTGMNNQTSLATNAATNATNVSIADSKNKTTMDVAGMNIEAKKDLQKSDQEYGKEMQAERFAHEGNLQGQRLAHASGEAAKDRALKEKVAVMQDETTRQGQVLHYDVGQTKNDIERDRLNYQKQKDAEAKALAAAELARKNALAYKTNEDTGEDELRDPVSNTYYGYMDKSSGELIIRGHTPSTVRRMSRDAERLGAKLITEYVKDPLTGRKKPQYAYKVGNVLCDTLEEVQQVAGNQR